MLQLMSPKSKYKFVFFLEEDISLSLSAWLGITSPSSPLLQYRTSIFLLHDETYRILNIKNIENIKCIFTFITKSDLNILLHNVLLLLSQSLKSIIDGFDIYLGGFYFVTLWFVLQLHVGTAKV